MGNSTPLSTRRKLCSEFPFPAPVLQSMSFPDAMIACGIAGSRAWIIKLLKMKF